MKSEIARQEPSLAHPERSNALGNASQSLDSQKVKKQARAKLQPRPCEWCETEFTPFKNKDAKHCSSRCRIAHWKDDQKKAAVKFGPRIESIEQRLSRLEKAAGIKEGR